MSLTRIAAFTLIILTSSAVAARAQETIVFMRHAEKPPEGLGQLTCQGLNRAIALTDVLTAKFGKPDFIYAPNPSVKINDPSGSSPRSSRRRSATACRSTPTTGTPISPAWKVG
jgi:hypothetical protein